MCAIPFLLALFFSKEHKVRNTLLIFSLFISVDNASEALAITPSLVRYPIYIYALVSLYIAQTFSIKRLLGFSLVVSILLIRTFFNFVNIDLPTLIRDVTIIALVVPLMCFTRKENSVSVDLSLLSLLLTIFLFSELVNIAFRTNIQFDSSDYLSYVSTKSLIVFPSIYCLVKGKVKIGILLTILTLIVLIFYSTRMLILTYIISFSLLMIKKGVFNIQKVFSVTFLFVTFLFVTYFFLVKYIGVDLESFKATGVFFQFFVEGDLSEKILLIDPVRYYESKLFFQRNIFSILLGDGLGSPLIDIHNELSFVKITDTAFSEQELRSGYFYNLHDTWIDLGLRFGFLLVGLVYFIIYRMSFIDNHKIANIIGLVLLVIFSCATYSTQGIILITFFFQAYFLTTK